MALIGGLCNIPVWSICAISGVYVLVYMDLCVILHINCGLIVRVCRYIVVLNAQDKFLLRETIKANLTSGANKNPEKAIRLDEA